MQSAPLKGSMFRVRLLYCRSLKIALRWSYGDHSLAGEPQHVVGKALKGTLVHKRQLLRHLQSRAS